MEHKGNVRIFFEENSKKVFGYMLKMSGNREDAEDCFQDCFIKYSEKYPDRLSLPLLFTVAKSICIDNIRKNRKFISFEHDIEGTSSDPETHASENETAKTLMKAMEKLSEQERQLISMAGADGLKYEEIAEITGLTTANIKVIIHRARKKLRKLLTEKSDGK